MPIKFNVILWMSSLDRIPTRLNLRDRGIDLYFMLLLVDSQVGESISHIFILCPLITPILDQIARWWGFPFRLISLFILCYLDE